MNLFKKSLSICLIAAMVLGFSTTTFAADQEYKLTKVSGTISTYGMHYFHNGLMPIFDEVGWAYINTKGQVVNINSGSYGYDFSEGLAAFEDENTGLMGYMDTTGKVIIPAKFDTKDYQGMRYIGRFINGNALVFKSEGMDNSGTSEGYWYQIDKSGNTVSTSLSEDTTISDATGNTQGVSEPVSLTIDGLSFENVEFSEGFAFAETSDYTGEYYIIEKVTASSITSTSATVTTVQAKPTASTILSNNSSVKLEAYNINGNNYFKLRDISMLVKDTDKRFEVTWDETKKAINLISKQDYTPTGGELALGNGLAKQAVLNSSDIYLDGQIVDLTAYTINSNNYFKLRDLAKAFNIGITWDSSTNTIGIDTAKEYTE